MRQTCLNALYDLAQKDERVFFIGSDLGPGTLSEFQEKLPKQFVMEGVSEGHVVGLASGLALSGKIPYVNTIASFLTRRAFEQIVLDCSLPNLKVRLIGNGGGFVYAPLGPTHLAIEDLSIMRAIPNMTIVSPCDALEMKNLMPQTLEYDGPIYIRLGKGHDPVISDKFLDQQVSIGQARVVRRSQPVPTGEVLILSTGVVTQNAFEASKILEKEGIETTVLHLPTVKPLDKRKILALASEAKAVLTVEENTVIGGLGSAVADLLMESLPGNRMPFKKLGIQDQFSVHYGTQKELMDEAGLSVKGIIESIKALLLTSDPATF